MYNNLLVSLAVSAVPLLALTFVVVLLLQKIYVQIRSRFTSNVNCWFCNQNTKVPYLEANSWTCPHCDQYNGFTKDGDYNREIYEQLDCSNLSTSSRRQSTGRQTETTTPNGFCHACNEAQRLKVEKLAQFEPKNESHFDKELKIYKAQLEKEFGLCASCDRHLKRVLREKKKMVLGSKFLDYLLRGAGAMKQPHFAQLRKQQQQQWKQRLGVCLTLCAFVNVGCLCTQVSIPQLTLEGVSSYFGPTMAQPIFVAFSHVVAFLRAVAAFLEACVSQEVVLKLRIFCRTIFLMLLYSLGLKIPQLVRVDFVSLFLLASPYTLLVLAFGHNIVDNFRLSRYTFLLGMWSLLSANFVGNALLSQHMTMFLASVITFLFSVTKSHDESAAASIGQNTSNQSFHRIYSEDYLSDYDEDTLSLLSQQLQTSTTSQRSTRSTNSTTATTKHYAKSPLSPRSVFSPNASMNSYLQPNRPQARVLTPLASPYAPSVCSFSADPQSPYQWQATHFGASAAAPGFSFQAPQRTFPYNAGSLTSPLSVSTATIYQPQRATTNQLLSPSRFSMSSIPQSTTQFNCLGTYNNPTVIQRPVCETVIHDAEEKSTTQFNCLGNYNNQTVIQRPVYGTVIHDAEKSTTQFNCLGTYNNPTVIQRPVCGTVIHDAEEKSRSSSHSSGFESQSNERLLASREPSNGRDSVGTEFFECKAFQPINQHSARASVRQPDCFNLRQIDAHLPSYQRGDLLRKWKETQSIS